MATINRNGKSYGSADVSIALLGSIDFEVTKLEYSVSQDHQPNYSAGSADPTSYSMGKKTYKCSLGLRMKSVAAIEKAAGGDLLKIKPFPITVVYTDENNEIITDVIVAKFADQGRSVGDESDLKKDFDMFCLSIDFNI
ncbi:MAG: hypothetical protein IK032_07665 [Bacteroidales bacterium]|nr:hypothetical protein [Bacteroidales bacterium]